jgi:hypothetical protein
MRPSEQFVDFLRAGWLNVRYIAKNFANRGVHGLLGALHKILERHAQRQRFLRFSKRKANRDSLSHRDSKG